MRGHPDDIDRALATLCDAVADGLSTAGWKRRVFDDDRTHAILTRPTQNGVMAVVSILRTSFQWPDDWPVAVEANLGVGYEPAVDLMPLLTLPPRAMLIPYPDSGGGTSFAIELDGLHTVAHATQQIKHFVTEHTSTVPDNFPDAAAIDACLQSPTESPRASSDEETEDQGNDPGASDFDTRLRLVVLAAMGRHEEARALLASYPAQQTDQPTRRSDRRFIRQLTRWLDAGGPIAPPVEETLAQLPRLPRAPRPSWADVRAESKVRKEALAATRAKSKGKSLSQLKELIAVEYGGRGIEIAPSNVDFKADMLQLGQQRFGRARTTIKTIRMLKSGGGDAVRLIKRRSAEDPGWLQPPDRAAYPAIVSQDRYTSVEIDAGAYDWLERVRSEAPRRIGSLVLIDVWLSRDEPAGPLIAHIGERRVGMVSSSATKEFDQALRAAALFDEDPFVGGRLAAAALLEIPLPERHNPGAAI